MNINAIITDVTRLPDFTCRLTLGSYNDDPKWQETLIVENPPANLEAAVGTHIWGNSVKIMIGDRVWAVRIGYTHIRLIHPMEAKLKTALREIGVSIRRALKKRSTQ